MSVAAQIALLSPIYVPLILSAVLFSSGRFSDRAKVWLAIAMLNASFVFLGNYLYFSHQLRLYSILHSFHIFSVLAVYPSVFIYVKLLTIPGYRLQNAMKHFVPSFLFFLFSASGFYLFLNPEQRIYFLSTYRLNPSYDNLVLHYLSFVRICNIATLFIQILTYGFLIFKALAEHRKQVGDFFSNTSGISLRWIRFFNLAIILAAFGSIFFYAINPVKLFGDERYLIVPLYLFAGVIWVLGILGNNQRPIFADGDISAFAEPTSEEVFPAEDQLSRALIDYMEREKAYLNPDLKIWDVSLALHTNRTYISRIINQVHGSNFNQFINRYRVKYSKEMLRKGEKKLEEVAQASGFGSVSTLIRAYKEMEGMTPFQWKKLQDK